MSNKILFCSVLPFSPFYIIKALNGKLTILGDFFSLGPVILLGHFHGLIWESFPIQTWPLFSQFQEFWHLFFPTLIKYVTKCEGKASFLKSQIKSLHTQIRKEPHLSLCSV